MKVGSKRFSAWFSLVLTIALLVPWMMTLRLSPLVKLTPTERLGFSIGPGALVGVIPPGSGTVSPANGKFFWIPMVYRYPMASFVLVVLPLWIPPALAAAVTVWLFVSVRRKRTPVGCGNCGYNLRGNISGICPECGNPVNSQTASMVDNEIAGPASCD